MEENIELRRARQIVEFTDTHLFLTGKAGTGKTTFLRQLVKDSPKRMVVLAPTGIAAINAGGSTIHSFFQLDFAPFVPTATASSRKDFNLTKRKINLIRSLDLIVIDEISMVRADLLDNVDNVLRRLRNRNRPFGGVQLLLIGDLQQLAPVVKDEEWQMLHAYYETPYFFSSRALAETHYVTIELTQVFRQRDERFITLLNRVRDGSADDQVLASLNARYVPDFKPNADAGYVRLVTHNAQAHAINSAELEQLSSPAFEYSATVRGKFPETSFPTDATLTLKRDAQIMFVKNDPERRFFNGMLGKIVDIDQKGFKVRTSDGSNSLITVEPTEWVNTRYALNETTGAIEEKMEGAFMQFPVRLAWAITIHKSQGLTFEHAIIDAHLAFAHGQTYVALSRCKSIEGLVLSTPIPPEAIICDQQVSRYTRQAVAAQPTDEGIAHLECDFYRNTITSLFDFTAIRFALAAVVRVVEEHFYKLYPKTLECLKQQQTLYATAVDDVAAKFRTQLERLVAEKPDYAGDAVIAERVAKGCHYFFSQFKPLYDLVKDMELTTDNKEVMKRSTARIEELEEAMRTRLFLLNYVETNGFHLTDYLRHRATADIESQQDEKKKQKEEKAKAKAAPKTYERIVVPNDVQHPDLFRKLLNWRYAKSKQLTLPAYTILQQKALLGITNLLPATPEQLRAIPYFGAKGFEAYGEELLAIVKKYMEESHARQPEIKTETVIKGKVREGQESSQDTSFRLFSSGKSVAEIAKERMLSETTIFLHLSRFVESGKLSLSALVPKDHERTIMAYLNSHNNELVYADFTAACPDINYAEARLVKDRSKSDGTPAVDAGSV